MKEERTDLPWFTDAEEVNKFRKKALKKYKWAMRKLERSVVFKDFSRAGVIRYENALQRCKEKVDRLYDLHELQLDYIMREWRKAREAQERSTSEQWADEE